jgi:hypothetical protein
MTTRIHWTLLLALFGVLTAGRAYAQTPCANDLDCPDTACGGQVCTHSSGGTQCSPAGEQAPLGGDGWCGNSAGVADDNNCKCKAQGATCAGFNCTFTLPADAPTGAGGRGGATGTGGGAAGTTGGASAGTGGGGGGCSIAGAPSFGGATGVALMLAAMIRRRARRR